MGLHNEKAEVHKKYNFSLFIEKEVLVLKSVNHQLKVKTQIYKIGAN